jgi:predicted ATPase
MDAAPPVAKALVGRGGELSRLRALLTAAAAGEPGAMFISGEAGVGKTALIREACNNFGGQVLVGVTETGRTGQQG